MTEIHDVIIIGGGIAAHTAAIYTARAKLAPIVLAAIDLDQLSLTTTVENFPGFPEGVQGPELVSNAKKQAKKFGATYITGKVKTIKQTNNNFEVTTDKETYTSRTVIIATGASARKLGITGEDTYFGKGVSTCAVCDAALYTKKEVVVIGGGDAAMEEALALYKFADKISIIHRRDEFRASKIMQDRVLKLTDKIEVVWDSIAVEVIGDGKFVTGIKIKNVKKNEEKEIPCSGVFLAVGHIPNTEFAKETIKLDEHNYITTDKKAQTNVQGIYAGGDCQDPTFKQAITSAGSGCKASIQAERYIEKLKAEGKY